MMNNAIVASPCFSVGLGHVIEVMLLLDIKVDMFGFADYWEKNNVGWNLSKKGYEHLKGHSKFLKPNDVFLFSDKCSILVEHQPRMIHEIDKYYKTVLLVRDPFDAIYSWHRRISPPDINFNNYLNSILYFAGHHPYALFQGKPLDIFSIFCVVFMAACEDLLIVRYEDLKSSPECWLAFLKLIGVTRTLDQVTEAVNKSNSILSEDKHYNEANRGGGVIYEYQKRNLVKEHDYYLSSGMINDIAYMLGYINTSNKIITKIREQSVLENLSNVVFSNLFSENDFGTKYSNPTKFIAHFNNSLFDAVPSVIRYHLSAGYTFNADDVDFICCHRATIRFILELYKDVNSAHPSKIRRIYSHLVNFLFKNFGNNDHFLYEKFANVS